MFIRIKPSSRNWISWFGSFVGVGPSRSAEVEVDLVEIELAKPGMSVVTYSRERSERSMISGELAHRWIKRGREEVRQDNGYDGKCRVQLFDVLPGAQPWRFVRQCCIAAPQALDQSTTTLRKPDETGWSSGWSK
jgi:hypothetical protein